MDPLLFQFTLDIPLRTKICVPHEQEVVEKPFDVALITGDGKKLEAHRSVLSEASPFFEKLLGSDMKEAKEGVVRMEIITELGLKEVLEFIYTGSVQISAEDNAQDLIALADYLILPHLKDLAARTLQRNLNSSNSLSMYYLAEKFRCEDLMSNTRDFILANFTSVTKKSFSTCRTRKSKCGSQETTYTLTARMTSSSSS